MENSIFLFAAYSIVWIAVFGYVLYLYRKQKRVLNEIKLIKERIDKKEKL